MTILEDSGCIQSRRSQMCLKYSRYSKNK